jgi:hypothetical protein
LVTDCAVRTMQKPHRKPTGVLAVFAKRFLAIAILGAKLAGDFFIWLSGLFLVFSEEFVRFFSDGPAVPAAE